MPYNPSQWLSATIGSLDSTALLLESLSGEEAISRLFKLQLEMVAENQVSFSEVIGQTATVKISSPDDPNGYVRYFNGIISRFEEGDRVIGTDGTTTLIRYRAEMVPALWKLTQTVQSQIFTNMSATDIVENILKTYGLNATADSSDITRPQCAQYRESDFNLFARLLESEGFAYYFVEASSGETLYISADATKYQAIDDPSTVQDQTIIDDNRAYGVLWSWGKSQQINPVTFKSRETDYTLAKAIVDSHAEAAASITAGTVTHFNNDLGSGISEFDNGGLAQFSLGASTPPAETVATIEANRLESQMVTIDGTSGCLNFAAGRTFTIGELVGQGSTRWSEDTARAGDYLLTGVEHQASVSGAFTDPAGPIFDYQNRFRCVPKEVNYLPPRVAQWPTIDGVQTALVVDPGDGSAEISTDSEGRVSVRPFWADEGNLLSARVGSMWAGDGFGAVRIPRNGEEVILAFVNGDPDEPLVVGCVYNATNIQPYALPGNETRTVLKTRSTPNGGTDNFNELRFEDEMGKEEIFFHAEKDFNREVENNDTLKVGSDQADDGSQTIDIYNNRTVTIEQGNDSLTINTGDETITISKGNQALTISQGDQTISIDQGNRAVTIKQGNDTLTIQAGGRTTEIEKDDELTIQSGNQTIKVSAGQSTTEAQTGIKLTVGPSSIEISPSGIQIKAPQVEIEGQASVDIKSDAMMTVKAAAMNEVGSDGILELKGGITTIN